MPLGAQPHQDDQAAGVREGRPPAAPQASAAHRAQLNAPTTFTKLGPDPSIHPPPTQRPIPITEPAVSHAGAEQGAAVSQGPSWSPSLRSRSTHVEGDSGREGQADDDRSGDEQRVHQRSVAATTAARAGKSPPLWSAPRQRIGSWAPGTWAMRARDNPDPARYREKLAWRVWRRGEG